MVLTKEYINDAKVENGDFANLIKNTRDNVSILFLLENLGSLPEDFDGDVLLPLLENENTQIRYWAVKTLGKLHHIKHAHLLAEIAAKDDDSMIRREAVSAIGRR